MANQWEPKEFTAEEIHNMRADNKIVVPLYQRGKVWKPNQKNDLIDSIKKGLPFGSILLYQDDIMMPKNIFIEYDKDYVVNFF